MGVLQVVTVALSAADAGQQLLSHFFAFFRLSPPSQQSLHHLVDVSRVFTCSLSVHVDALSQAGEDRLDTAPEN